MGLSHPLTEKSDHKASLKTGRHARFIYICLPELGLSRIAREHKLDEAAPTRFMSRKMAQIRCAIVIRRHIVLVLRRYVFIRCARPLRSMPFLS